MTYYTCPICCKRFESLDVVNIEKPVKGWVLYCEVGAWAHIYSMKDDKEHLVYMRLAAMGQPAARQGR